MICLKKKTDFSRVFAFKEKIKGYYFSTYRAPGTGKFGFIASKKNIGNAVMRNRAKRRLRGVISQYSLNQSFDYILLAYYPLLKAPYSKLCDSFNYIINQ